MENADEEVCGLLLGRSGSIDAALPAGNIASNRKRTFELDPTILFEAHRTARAGGPAILGHYHSHPTGGAKPSSRDADAAETGQLWLIVAGKGARLFEACRNGPLHGRFVERDYELR